MHAFEFRNVKIGVRINTIKGDKLFVAIIALVEKILKTEAEQNKRNLCCQFIDLGFVDNLIRDIKSEPERVGKFSRQQTCLLIDNITNEAQSMVTIYKIVPDKKDPIQKLLGIGLSESDYAKTIEKYKNLAYEMIRH